MKINLSKIFYSYNILLEISENKTLPFKISYWCMKNLKEMENNANFYINSRNNLFEQYLEKNEDGNILQYQEEDGTLKGKIVENCIEEFKDKMTELEELICEINPYQLELNYLLEQKDFKISGNQLMYLDFLIKEE